jgi:hypothetical protein
MAENTLEEQEIMHAWAQQNPWFHQAPELGKMAGEYDTLLARTGNKMPLGERIEYVGRKIKRVRADLFVRPGNEDDAYALLEPDEQSAFIECLKHDRRMTPTAYLEGARRRDMQQIRKEFESGNSN